MADDAPQDPDSTALAPQPSANISRPKRDYSDEDKYSALAALDFNGGNVYRTAIAYDLPESTLRTWRDERAARGGGPSNLEKRKRGNLQAKIEDKIHSIIESITPDIIKNATLAQRLVSFGILNDHLHKIRQYTEPDPAAEICRILNIRPEQLPAKLELLPGEEIPEGFGPILETVQNPDNPNSFEVQSDSASSEQASPPGPDSLPAHAPDCLGFTDINDSIFKACSCGLIPSEPEPDDEGSIN